MHSSRAPALPPAADTGALASLAPGSYLVTAIALLESADGAAHTVQCTTLGDDDAVVAISSPIVVDGSLQDGAVQLEWNTIERIDRGHVTVRCRVTDCGLERRGRAHPEDEDRREPLRVNASQRRAAGATSGSRAAAPTARRAALPVIARPMPKPTRGPHPRAVAVAIAAPPAPAPSATPSTLASCIDAEAAPSRPAAASASTTRLIVACAMPIPSPASAHATTPAQSGVLSTSGSTRPASPSASTSAPAATTARAGCGAARAAPAPTRRRSR